MPLIRALNNGIKRAVFVAHRRAGKDILAFNWCIMQLLLNPGWTAFHILPTYNQAKKVIWDSNTNDSKRLLDYIPPEAIQSKNGQEMKIRLNNGSLYQLIGSDNIDSLVGTNPKIIIFSEYAIQSPAAWEYLRPILDVNKGFALFISTPRGKNHFYDLMNMAKTNPNWFCEVLSITDTNVLTEADIDAIRAEGVSEELIQQEYYCSFNRGVEGSYYGRLIEKARNESRICNVPYEPRSPVHTAFDIGYGDSTSITFWQEIGGEVRIIDFYENQGEGIAHYAKLLQSKPYVYGTHYMPHDAGSGSIQTGRTLQDVARDIGLNTTVLERELDIQIGIESARSLLSIAYIDEKKCSYLIKCLENYHKRFNDKTQVYSQNPEHDWTSHACFIGSTLILTDRGNISIEDIKIGDLVLTPFGYRKVLEKHEKEVIELLELHVNDKYQFTCTKDHNIFTVKGLIYADTIRYNTLEKYGFIRNILWKMFGFFYEASDIKGFKKTILNQKIKNQSCLMDFFIDGMDSTIEEPIQPTIKLAHFIELFGYSIMEKFQMTWRYITKIITQRITTFQTLSLWKQESIKVCMPDCQTHGHNLNYASRGLKNRDIRLKNGINPVKEENGIEDTHTNRYLDLQERSTKKHAISVSNHIKQKSFTSGFAPTIAKVSLGCNLRLIMKRGIALFALKFLKLTNMLSKQHVVTHVVSRKCEIPVKVYDLTVENDGCYYANKYLVSNSDSVRYMANARIQFGRGPGSLTPDKLNKIKSHAGFGPKQVQRQIPNQPFIGR